MVGGSGDGRSGIRAFWSESVVFGSFMDCSAGSGTARGQSRAPRCMSEGAVDD